MPFVKLRCCGCGDSLRGSAKFYVRCQGALALCTDQDCMSAAFKIPHGDRSSGESETIYLRLMFYRLSSAFESGALLIRTGSHAPVSAIICAAQYALPPLCLASAEIVQSIRDSHCFMGACTMRRS
jgi:hypothetical protein